MVGPPFSCTADGRPFFLPPMEATMGATTIAVIVLVVVFLGGMATLVLFMNTPPKKGPTQPEDQAGPR